MAALARLDDISGAESSRGVQGLPALLGLDPDVPLHVGREPKHGAIRLIRRCIRRQGLCSAAGGPQVSLPFRQYGPRLGERVLCTADREARDLERANVLCALSAGLDRECPLERVTRLLLGLLGSRHASGERGIEPVLCRPRVPSGVREQQERETR